MAPSETHHRQRLGVPADARQVMVVTESTHWDPDWLFTSNQYFRFRVRRSLDQPTRLAGAHRRPSGGGDRGKTCGSWRRLVVRLRNWEVGGPPRAIGLLLAKGLEAEICAARRADSNERDLEVLPISGGAVRLEIDRYLTTVRLSVKPA